MPFAFVRVCRRLVAVLLFALITTHGGALLAQLKTWDGKHSIEKIDVTVVYFVPRDREPLPDWKERVGYFCRRIERFHEREFQGQSRMKALMRPEPFRSGRSTEQLRNGDANHIFFQTLREVDDELLFGRGERTAFPILLVLSEINWRPLDDFFRVKPNGNGGWKFEGNYSNGRHFPGADAGGARATYLADRGVGWGLVSADGWRVPYCGTDCVVYHEGCGHTVGLPHPEPGNNSVMSFGQYHGWISESWLDEAQKKRLGWKAPEQPFDRKTDLFSTFTALPEPRVPRPNEPVSLKLSWPESSRAKSCRIRVQTDLLGPWLEVAAPTPSGDSRPDKVELGRFDRATPVSYRVDVVLDDGRDAELWGYFQIREKPDVGPTPPAGAASSDTKHADKSAERSARPQDAIDLLALVDVSKDQVSGEWQMEGTHLLAPKKFGARLELPYQPPGEYELTVIAEPLDQPNGLLLGQLSGDQRFAVLVNYATGEGAPASALENIDGKNVGNTSTVLRDVLVKGRPSQIVCTVRKDSVTVTCDGHELVRWQGDPKRLSLSDYWKTPTNSALFLGAYDCRYRFSRVTLTPLSDEGRKLR